MTTSDRFSAVKVDEPKCNKGTSAVEGLGTGSGDRGREAEPLCAARSSPYIPGELSAIWCDRCGEGTTAGGICRDRSGGGREPNLPDDVKARMVEIIMNPSVLPPMSEE